MSNKVSIEGITLTNGPAVFTQGVPYLIAAYVFVAGFLVTGYNHHFLLMRGIFGAPVPKL